MTETLSRKRTSTALERCDRCGAQAKVHVTLRAGGDLFFCGHHGRQHEDRLRKVGATYATDSDRLTAPPARG